MKLTRAALLVGLVVVPAFLLTGCGDKAAQRSTINADIKNCKDILGAVKETWNAGKVQEGSDDGRLGLIVIIMSKKVPYKINKRMTDPKRQVALAKATEVSKFMDDTLIPKLGEAIKSNKPEDAKAMLPLGAQLDKLLDELNNVMD